MGCLEELQNELSLEETVAVCGLHFERGISELRKANALLIRALAETLKRQGWRQVPEI